MTHQRIGSHESPLGPLASTVLALTEPSKDRSSSSPALPLYFISVEPTGNRAWVPGFFSLLQRSSSDSLSQSPILSLSVPLSISAISLPISLFSLDKSGTKKKEERRRSKEERRRKIRKKRNRV
jgi:hypothetical protein